MVKMLTCLFLTQFAVFDHNTIDLRVPFDRFMVYDNLNRKISAYLSKAPLETDGKKLSLILFINGSGCQSVWTRCQNGVNSGLQGLIYHLVESRARVLVVEKPGVKFLDTPKEMGTATEGSKKFLEEHTLARWAEANMAALKAVMFKPWIDSTRIMVIGHSEGGIVAARVAAEVPEVTHVAPLGCGGVTQLFSLAELARIDAPADQKEAAVQKIFDNWAKILIKPDSIKDFWMGHPYRRWSTFLSNSVVDELNRSKAKVYLAQGTRDQADSVIGFDVMLAELLAKGRDVTSERVEGGDHDFSMKCDGSGRQSVFSNVVEWFFR